MRTGGLPHALGIDGSTVVLMGTSSVGTALMTAAPQNRPSNRISRMGPNAPNSPGHAAWTALMKLRALVA